MSLSEVTTDMAVLKQTLAFFAEMGFNDHYIEAIERDLMCQEQRYHQLVCAQLTA